ncbi:rna-binding domain-containing protein [Phaffia rhodozyma]|uniref:Rna-binding domain-containing protein n=1 Tax=Phaffia rhodozyma TaxID=264483 RepID=A0A0F7SV80_PHARH|nr:rna-binding domain-containing protein [Phaffia rhodozyma]
MPFIDDKKPKRRTTVTEPADKESVNPTVAEQVTAKSAARDVTHKPWSRRVQQAPQPLPKSLTQKKSTTTATPSSSTQQSQKKRKAPEPKVIDPESESVKNAPLLKGLEQTGYHSTSEDDEEEDSSDDEDESDVDINHEGPVEGIELTKLPTINKDDEVVKKKLEKAKKSSNKEKGVLYLGRIPHGFYEKQMKSYFEQFGTVEKVRLARNKRTGASKHYAFILMAQASVAQIVAETMDNYLLLGRLLQCKVIPNDKVHPDLWAGANRTFRPIPSVRAERLKLEAPRTASQQAKAEGRLKKRGAAKRAKLAALGVDYDLSEVDYKKASA